MNGQARSDYAPSWYTTTMVAAPERAPLASNLDVDVCVIGAGLAGLTTAREIARSGWSVAVLEARRIAWNASGLNCGFVLPGFSVPPSGIIERVGRERAKALWSLSEMGLEYVRTAIAEAGMPGVQPVDGWLNVSKTDDPESLIRTVQLLGEEFGAEVEGWATDRVRQALKCDRYFNAVHFPRAFHLHPLNYALGLAALAEAAGAHVFEHTPALEIDPDGVRKLVKTPHGRLRAAHVVLAGNVHMGKLVPQIDGTLIPIWTYLATTAPLGALAEAIAYRGAVSDGERADNHYRVIDGDRLLISGRATVWQADPRRFAKSLRDDVTALYPQLGLIAIEHLWSGVLGRTIHGMPQIGEVSPGIWLASGFGGHGFNTTAMAGNLIARAVVEGDDAWRLFLPYELIWAGGALGRAVTQFGIWWGRARIEAGARQARKRKAEKAAEPAGHSEKRPEASRSRETSPAQETLPAQETSPAQEAPAAQEASSGHAAARPDHAEPPEEDAPSVPQDISV